MLEEFIKRQSQELIKRQAKEVKHQQEKEVKYQQDQKAMIEFDDRDLRELQDVDGIVLQDVHGQRVAIGKGFDYGNVFKFMSAYFDEYGAEDFAKKIGYEDAADMFKKNVFEFMSAYFEEYGANDFAKQVGYEAIAGIFKAWLSGIQFYERYFTNWVSEAFAGIDADLLQDQYDYENEDYLEAEDHKLDQERGK